MTDITKAGPDCGNPPGIPDKDLTKMDGIPHKGNNDVIPERSPFPTAGRPDHTKNNPLEERLKGDVDDGPPITNVNAESSSCPPSDTADYTAKVKGANFKADLI